MPLTYTTGNPYIDSQLDAYNRLEAAHDSPSTLLRLLLKIEGLIRANIAGRRGLTMRAETSREILRVRNQLTPHHPMPQAQAPQILPQVQPQALQPIPPLPPVVVPAPASAPVNRFAYFVSQFKKGADLLYGRSGTDYRDKYVMALSPDCWQKAHPDHANLRMQPDADMDFVIIDTYNNAFLGTEVFSSAIIMTQGGREKKADRRKAIAPITDFAATSERSQTYLGKLPDEHEEVGGFRDFLETKTSYNLDEIRSPDGLQLRYGRACKAGMAFAIFKRHGKVHFALDGIDSKSVLEDMAAARNKRRITGKELRWIFRHRDVPEVRNEVIFWLDGAKTRPLWELDPGPWQEYDEQVQARASTRKGVDKALGRLGST